MVVNGAVDGNELRVSGTIGGGFIPPIEGTTIAYNTASPGAGRTEFSTGSNGASVNGFSWHTGVNGFAPTAANRIADLTPGSANVGGLFRAPKFASKAGIGCGLATMASGTITINVPGLDTTDLVFVQSQSATVTGALRCIVNAGADTVTINSTNGADAGNIAYFVVSSFIAFDDLPGVPPAPTNP